MLHQNIGLLRLVPTLTYILLSSMAPTKVNADNYSLLKGYWQCQEEGVPVTLDFQSRNTVKYNGEVISYEMLPGILRVQEEYGFVDYQYQIDESVLKILAPDGSVTLCQKAQKSIPVPQTSQRATGDVHGWPPPYTRPQGPVDEETPSAQALLYKFAGRWTNATSNTLNNIFLKPDGSYEQAYEAGYSGEFRDEGGYQTGHWGSTGTQSSSGRWYVQGSLKSGVLTLVDQNGRRTDYQYQVHVKHGEIYWGEYFFNGVLYSVNYIYR